MLAKLVLLKRVPAVFPVLVGPRRWCVPRPGGADRNHRERRDQPAISRRRNCEETRCCSDASMFNVL